MKLFLEKYGPITLSTLIALFLLFNAGALNMIDFAMLSDSSLIVFSVLLGFLLTVSTLLHTINNEVMRLIRSGNYYTRLSSYLNCSIRLSFFASLASLSAPIFKGALVGLALGPMPLLPYIKIAYLFLLFLAILSCYRFIRLFMKIMSSG